MRVEVCLGAAEATAVYSLAADNGPSLCAVGYVGVRGSTRWWIGEGVRGGRGMSEGVFLKLRSFILAGIVVLEERSWGGFGGGGPPQVRN